MKLNSLHKYYLFTLFASADVTRGIHLVYLLKIGFSNLETGIFQTILFVASLFAEIPTGYLADKYKKKYSLVAGAACFALASLIYMFSEDFFAIAILYMVQGVGFAFYSGANQALLYEISKGQTPEFSDFYLCLANSRAISTYTLSISIVLGGYLYSTNLLYLFGALLFSSCGAALLAASIPEPRDGYHQTSSPISLGTTAKTVSIIIRDRSVVFFVLGIAFLEAVHTPYFIYFPNFLVYRNVDSSIISAIVALSMVLSALSYSFSSRLKHYSLKSKIYFVGCVLCILISLHFLALNWLAYAFIFLVINTLPHMLFIFTDEYINSLIPDEIRSTGLSIISAVNAACISGAYLLFGHLHDGIGGDNAMGSFLFLLIPVFFLTSLAFRKKG